MAMRVCPRPGCPTLIPAGTRYCAAHERAYDVYATAEGLFAADDPTLVEPLVAPFFAGLARTAAFRTGWALTRAAELAFPRALPSAATLAAAEAALGDEDFLQKSYETNRAGMAQVVEGLNALNLEHIPSVANFVTFRVGDGAGVNRRLLQQGVIVRPIASYGMPEWLRVTIGTAAENVRFLEALAQALKG